MFTFATTFFTEFRTLSVLLKAPARESTDQIICSTAAELRPRTPTSQDRSVKIHCLRMSQTRTFIYGAPAQLGTRGLAPASRLTRTAFCATASLVTIWGRFSLLGLKL